MRVQEQLEKNAEFKKENGGMRTLLLLRGAPGSGKSTWIEKNGLKRYTLSPDELRLMCQSPVMTPDGSEAISQENEKIVWKIFEDFLETRMRHGDFTVIDATNSRSSELKRYRELCGRYKYRIYCVDFTDVPAEEAKRRNRERENFRRVPESYIDMVYARFDVEKVPSGISVIGRDELDKVWLKKRDFSDYKRIHLIGDIHGCYTVLKRYLDSNGGIKTDEMYIFLGDYIDRGPENAEVIRFLLSVMDRKNVLLLEGNHEKNLWLWANDYGGATGEFEHFTRTQLENAGIDKKAVRNLYRKFGQCAYYSYHGKTYLVTHGGLGTMPDHLSLVAAQQMICGCGSFDEVEKADETFYRTAPDCYQIHGHRNPKMVPIKVNERTFNLEGKVECGGCLRCVQADGEGIRGIEVKNEVFRPMRKDEARAEEAIPEEKLVSVLRASKYIQEKVYGNYSSFNFTDEAFQNRIWNDLTVRARGLYLDTSKNRIAARAYEKFWNVNERPETRFDTLWQRLVFPVTAYVKENGYLGIVSYDAHSNDLLIACKSTLDSKFVQWFRELLYGKLSDERLERLKSFVKENPVSLVFECIEINRDPHIIEYPESSVVLLDIVYNKSEFEKYDYERLCRTAEQLGFTAKEKAYEFACWQDFYDWYFDVRKDDYRYNGRYIEGFVLEDSDGCMVKLKLAYYNFWKRMRSMAQVVLKKGDIQDTAVLTDALAYEFYAWLKKQYECGNTDVRARDICALRRRFLEERNSSYCVVKENEGYYESKTG